MNRETDGMGADALKRLRHEKGLSQLVVELDSGIGQGSLSKIECNKRRPEKETLITILNALDAKYTERKNIMELFGYLIPASPPNQKDIGWAIDVSTDLLDNFKFPAYLLDCTHTLHSINNKVHNLIGKTHEQALCYVGCSMVDIVFNQIRGLGVSVHDPDGFYSSFAQILKYEMNDYISTDWYKSLMEQYITNFPLFAKYWKKLPNTDKPKASSRQITQLNLAVPTIGNISFYIFSEPFIRDTRFRIIYYIPSDTKTMELAQRW